MARFEKMLFKSRPLCILLVAVFVSFFVYDIASNVDVILALVLGMSLIGWGGILTALYHCSNGYLEDWFHSVGRSLSVELSKWPVFVANSDVNNSSIVNPMAHHGQFTDH